MITVELKPIKTVDEYLALSNLKVHEEQKGFSNNLESFADAFAWLEIMGDKPLVFGMYHDNIPVGLAMIVYERAQDHGFDKLDGPIYVLWRFMIDKNHQGKGLGKAALAQVVGLIKAKKPLGEAGWLCVTVAPENHPARKLYENAGFVEMGTAETDVMMHLAL
ncbi:MAG: GNAT family N-acetyltransferase [Defluviitaleaceae bacterium]|nr:GNAT family N-acetyltransferase [Defluviitaleaceae bacterium]